MSSDSTGPNSEAVPELPVALPVRGGMTVNAYAVLVLCVERGVVLG